MIIENPELNKIFQARSANEWMAEGGQEPQPAKLFGDLWLENELAILFADTAKGKSLLAVQIAESIARGRPIEPFEMTARAQKVIYLDFELTAKQFEVRYAGERKTGGAPKHYRFSDRFIRVQLRPEANGADESEKLEARIRKTIEPLVKATGAKVLIIDNITYLKRTADGTRETMPLMKELKRLKDSLGLSVLVIAHTPKRYSRRPLTVNDLAGSKILSNFVDNVFAIGQGGAGPDVRYIKHIKPRSGELFYSSAHVPVYRIAKIRGKFLGFEFLHISAEIEQLRDMGDPLEWELIERIKRMSEVGKSVRKIATELEMSKSKVHRLIQVAEKMPVLPRRSSPAPMSDDEDWAAMPLQIFEDETDEFADIYSRDDEEAMARRRELYLREIGQFEEPGNAVNDDEPPQEPEEVSPAKLIHPLLPPGLETRINGYGDEIYVEQFDERGKHIVWYQVAPSGALTRSVRKTFGIFVEVVGEASTA
jgi:hypothetical protein